MQHSTGAIGLSNDVKAVAAQVSKALDNIHADLMTGGRVRVLSAAPELDDLEEGQSAIYSNRIYIRANNTLYFVGMTGV